MPRELFPHTYRSGDGFKELIICFCVAVYSTILFYNLCSLPTYVRVCEKGLQNNAINGDKRTKNQAINSLLTFFLMQRRCQ